MYKVIHLPAKRDWLMRLAVLMVGAALAVNTVVLIAIVRQSGIRV